MNNPISTGRILVVDDTEANRYTIVRILRKEGFEVLEAENGVAGLALVNDELDLVVLDIRMPEMDGYEVCRRIKAHPELRAIPILHVSATYTGTSDIAYGLESGADGYLTHPVDPAVLVATVRAFLRLRKADRALRASETLARSTAEELQAVMHAVPAAVMIAHDAECRTVTGNRAAHELLRLPERTNLSKAAGDADHPHFRIFRAGRELQISELPIQRAAATGTHISGEELEIRFQDDSFRHVYGSATPLFDDTGGVRGAVGAYVDMTDLHQARAQLERAQRMESIGTLAGGVAHETNNQMTVVLGFTQFLMGAANITAPQRRDLQQVKLSAERVAQLTRQLLALSRRQTLHTESLDLDALIRESRPLLQRLVGPENKLVMQLDSTPKWVRADRTQLIQVLLNLAMNARDAMPAEGGRVTIRTRCTNEVPSGGRFGREWNSEGAAILSVSDTGTGIDASISSRVFEPFFTTKAVGQGTGLGLSVVEGIIEQSNGEMWLSSEVGQGTTFTIALPLVQAAPDTHPRVEPTPEGGTETILLVDDEEAVRQVLARGLQEKGYRLVEASSASQALEILGRGAEDIDLVVTDLAMPEMNGIELAKLVSGISPFLPFIFVSGQPREALPELHSLGPGNPLLEKPFTPDALVACVRATLDLRPHASRADD